MNHPRRSAAIWEDVRDILAAEIADRIYHTGDRLPSEHSLATRFGVNRHTVRRALAALSEAGSVHVRHGAGAFVTAGRIDYPIGPQTRFTTNITALGMIPTQRFLRVETAPADAAALRQLGLPSGASVHIVESVGDANGLPVIYCNQIFAADRLPDFPAAIAKTQSVAAALEACGLGDCRRSWTRLSAATPTPIIARHLGMMPNQPTMISRNLKLDPEGRPIEYSESWFCAARVEIVVE